MTFRFLGCLVLLFFSVSANAGLKCADVKYGVPNYFESMTRLAEAARLPDNYFNRYHEDVVSLLCSGKSKDIEKIIDAGEVKRSEVEAIKEALNISGRSELGQSCGYSKQKFSELGLCSACADNVAQWYSKKPASRCGSLAKKALEGNPAAIDELQGFPKYCEWKYQ
ncbi:MAG: hypothetical protein J0I00_14285 [Burkholderiales bacterium]|nr:hypothetical protein [Burkholderiales bacterium]